MGTREDRLKSIMAPMATAPSTYAPYPRYDDIANAGYAEETMRVYQAMGGILDRFPDNVGTWDIVLNGVVIELDEERHFNRYRRITLDSSIYDASLGFDWSGYIRYCELKEGECLKAASHGGYWTNDSCERQFGQAGPKGILVGNGAPRWKQRAFYDFVKDLSPLVTRVQVVRVAMYDRIKLPYADRSVAEILDGRKADDDAALRSVVMDRIS